MFLEEVPEQLVEAGVPAQFTGQFTSGGDATALLAALVVLVFMPKVRAGAEAVSAEAVSAEAVSAEAASAPSA